MTARDVDRLLCVNGEIGPHYIQRADREKVAQYVRELEGQIQELQESAEASKHSVDAQEPA